MSKTSNDILMHYGIKRRSGRYPYGSGENPYQHEGNFYTRVHKLREEGFTFTDENGKTWTGDTAIAKSLGMSTTEFRTELSIAKNELRSSQVATAKTLKDKGYNNTEIAEMMGLPGESSVRSLLNSASEARMHSAQNTADFLKEQVDKKGMIDVGSGVERGLNVSQVKMKEAIYLLEREGYEVYVGRVPQATNPGKYTTIKVLCTPGTEYKEIYDYGNVKSVLDYVSYDNGESFRPAFIYPSSMDSNRLAINYGGEGGEKKDGLIEIRRGVDDLSLGDSHYAQVRILVDGTHYLKGMAVYSDNLPDGVDVVFNTKKENTGSKFDVLKSIDTSDPNNPFGSYIKENGGQSFYDDPNGKYTDPLTGNKQSLSLINKRSDEGDWGDWGKNLPSQFLSKQNMNLIDKQLNLSIADKQAEYDEICSYTNPTVKKNLLNSFADGCDATAVSLKAASLPRQQYQVIFPLTTISDNEVYAPSYHDGETVALIRYPHGGTFEIPILKVNNKQAEGKSILGGDSLDVVGISSNVAARLSGADFDGDTVMVIPCNSSRSKVHITTSNPLKDLEGFDPHVEYGGESEGSFKKLSKAQTQIEMGKISNLITDMTIKGAPEDELARAVKHSMVIIDANKHDLDYKRSEVENGIDALKKKYQGTTDENGNTHYGASTIISRASSPVDVVKRKGGPQIDPLTGEKTYRESYEEYTHPKTGKTTFRTQKSTQMAEETDAYNLVSASRNPKELAYASYANKLKAMANDARKEALNTGKIKYDAGAKETYKTEVKSLNDKLDAALMNAPRERQAQLKANSRANAIIQDNPDLDKKEKKKIKQVALADARKEVGASRTTINITDKEWEAIQAGAISETKLTQILNHTDSDAIKQRAMPKTTGTLSQAKINKIASMRASGYTIDQIAEALGVSASTVSKYLRNQ